MPEYLLQHYLDNSRRIFPGKDAVATPSEKSTYEQLYTLSNKLGNCLIANHVARQDRVCFCLTRSSKCILAIFGILKADAIYVPIDFKSPSARNVQIIKDCKPSYLIADGQTLPKIVAAISNVQDPPGVIVLDGGGEVEKSLVDSFICQEEIDQYPDIQPEYNNLDKDIAYILYTSGSTGRPKGVMISHLNIMNYINWAVECFAITQEDSILNTAPFHFDMSTFDIFCSVKTGARLCIAPQDYLLFPNKLLSYMEKERVTIWKGISSLLMYLVRTGSLQDDRIPTLKKVLFGGEVLPTKYLVEWMNIFPEKLFYNVYGPTEATGISTYYPVEKIPSSHESVPIGKPCTNTEVLLLRNDKSLAQLGEAGELCIRGSSLSRGYWNDQERTDRSFVRNPVSKIPSDTIYRTGDLALLRADGNYEFIGRKDDQVKWMGHRIQLGEIETALLSVKEVKNAAVILSESEDLKSRELVAFLELEDGGNPSMIMTELGLKVPRYMVPTRSVVIKWIPRTSRGKIDRQNLINYV